eukprot:c8548_g1_i2.p1 GENE.c8548_g1_i2~~c8548_g1_i2.p1  ORF type:complete len:767 (+),score=208.50 c8548_g1_i2:34-2334(+)
MGKAKKKVGKEKAANEIQELEDKIIEITPEKGMSTVGDARFLKFEQLPISSKTIQGLTKHSFTELTDIQQAAIPHALAGRDILGSARTGSGKTLAFVIPVLEDLFRASWSHMDGLGAVIISPTRELSVQIFDVLKQIGKYHSFSAGLVIGGKDKDTEGKYIASMNILVATPGRFLHHLETTPDFNCDNLRVLVLDEADRILDLGFEKTLTSIISYLPPTRQTMLFSATQTKSVKDIARLSLREPEWVFVHNKEEVGDTPSKLLQYWSEVPLPGKMDVLWSFIKTHLKQKVLVFLTSCKQVKFVFEAFRRQRPGVPLMCLHGKQKQHQRLDVFYAFCQKQFAVLFATDIAARGLDFPDVDWVVQADCPEDVPQYIHRVGRTARYRAGGKAISFFLPSEAQFVKNLEQAKIPLKKIRVDPARTMCIRPALQAAVIEDVELKHIAQKAFISYVRSIHLRGDKSVFDVTQLPLEEYAASLGLPNTPNVAFVERQRAKKDNQELQQLKKEIELEKVAGSDTSKEQSKPERRTKMDRLMARKNKTVLSEEYAKLRNLEDSDGEADDSDDDTGGVLKLVSKRRREEDEEEDEKVAPVLAVSSKKKLKKIRVSGGTSSKVVFDDEGNVVNPFAAVALELGGETDTHHQQHVESLRQDLLQRKEEDERNYRERIRSKHLKQRMKEKERNVEKRGGMLSGGAVLANPMDDDDGKYSSGSDGSGGEESDHSGGSGDDSNDNSGADSEDGDDTFLEDKGVGGYEDIALKLLQRSTLRQ